MRADNTTMEGDISGGSSVGEDPALTATGLQGDEHISDVLGGHDRAEVAISTVYDSTWSYPCPLQVTPGHTYDV